MAPQDGHSNARQVSDVMPQWRHASWTWRSCARARPTIAAACSFVARSSSRAWDGSKRSPSFPLTLACPQSASPFVLTRAHHRVHGHHCRRCKLHRCSLSFAVAAPSHAVHAPHRCRATAPPRRSQSSTDAPVRRSRHRLAAGPRGQGATASHKSGHAALGVRRHARRAARLPLAAGAAPPRRNRPSPTASVSLSCSLYEEEEGPTCKRETSPGGFLQN
jgi:hypothetical protein